MRESSLKHDSMSGTQRTSKKACTPCRLQITTSLETTTEAREMKHQQQFVTRTLLVSRRELKRRLYDLNQGKIQSIGLLFAAIESLNRITMKA